VAVSGSKNFAITRGDIIDSALRKIGGYDSGESTLGNESADASFALNAMVKSWASKGLDLPWRETVTLFLQPGTESFTIGPSGDHATTSYVETTLSAAEAAAQTVLSVTSSTGMTAADNVGIKLDDDTIQWTTISSVDSSTQITVATALTSAAASGNKVYSYTTKANRPQKIVYAFRRDTSGLDTEVELIGEKEYQRLSDKDSNGPVTQIFHRSTLTNATVFAWPADGGSSVDKLVLITQNLADDFDATADNPEFPIEWSDALIYGLAWRLAPEYGVTIDERRAIKAEAQEFLEDLLDYDVENASVIFSRDVR